MNKPTLSGIKAIRQAISMTQPEFGRAIGVTQGSVSFYERGVNFPRPHIAKRIVVLARKHGHNITMDAVYAQSGGVNQ